MGRRTSAKRMNGDDEAKVNGKSLHHAFHGGHPPEKEEQVLLFQKWCTSKYGNMLALWRKLDRDRNMSISKAEFLKGMKELNFMGKLSILWSILDNDTTGLITITEFVPMAALQLAKFKHWAEIKFGSVQQAFHHFDRDRNGKMTMSEFMRGCHAQDFPSDLKDSIQVLFNLMDDSQAIGRAEVTAEEMGFLDVWKCPEYLWAKPDDAAKEAFREALAARYGTNYLIAFRKSLDRDGTMRVNFPEFVQTCKRLAKHGLEQAAPACGVPDLYCAFDRMQRGWFSLRDWHDKSYEILAAFDRFAHQGFGKVSDCFKAMEHVASISNTSGISISSFKTQTKELNLSLVEKEYLFEGLSMEVESWSEEKGRFAHGRLSKAEIVFLDSWDPDQEQREVWAWDEQFRVPTPPHRFDTATLPS